MVTDVPLSVCMLAVKRLLRLLRKIFMHQSVLAQVVSTVSAILVVALLSRLLSDDDYADYAVVTAIWAIGNAIAGTGIGTRVARLAAEGCDKITFKVSEISVSLGVSIICGAYVTWLRASWFEGLIAALCMLTFSFAEASISFEIGAERFRRYFCLLSLRVIVPVVFLAIVAVLGSVSLRHAFLSVVLGNLSCLLPWFRRWSTVPYIGPSYSSHLVGGMNLGLWLIASADRVVLGQLVSSSELAVYALTYGLLDRFYRALSNAFITRSLGASFRGNHVIPYWKHYLASLLIFIAAIPATEWGAEFVSGGRYSPDLLLVFFISGAGLLMFWSAPHYVALLASGRYRTSIFVVGTIAVMNVIGNIGLGSTYGVHAAAAISLLSYLAWFLWLLGRPRSSN